MKSLIVAVVAIVAIGAGIWFFINDTTPVQWLGSNPPNSAEDAPPGSIHNLPVPAGVAAARARAAREAGVSESQVLIETAFEKEWPDGCLGLGDTDEFCTQALVPGYEVTVLVQGKQYVYRTNMDGSVVRKETR